LKLLTFYKYTGMGLHPYQEIWRSVGAIVKRKARTELCGMG